MEMNADRKRELDRAWYDTGYEELGISFGPPTAREVASRIVDRMLENDALSEVPHSTDGIAYPLMPSREINPRPPHDAPYKLTVLLPTNDNKNAWN